ncbi:hypothetical protein [Streptosporangium sandarakinum]
MDVLKEIIGDDLPLRLIAALDAEARHLVPDDPSETSRYRRSIG